MQKMISDDVAAPNVWVEILRPAFREPAVIIATEDYDIVLTVTEARDLAETILAELGG